VLFRSPQNPKTPLNENNIFKCVNFQNILFKRIQILSLNKLIKKNFYNF
jgi:hypothetical protein